MSCYAGDAQDSFASVLRSSRKGTDYSTLMAKLRAMAPAAIDQELRALQVQPCMLHNQPARGR